MDLYFQQPEWSALEIERITFTCNMHYMRNNYKRFLNKSGNKLVKLFFTNRKSNLPSRFYYIYILHHL